MYKISQEQDKILRNRGRFSYSIRNYNLLRSKLEKAQNVIATLQQSK